MASSSSSSPSGLKGKQSEKSLGKKKTWLEELQEVLGHGPKTLKQLVEVFVLKFPQKTQKQHYKGISAILSRKTNKHLFHHQRLIWSLKDDSEEDTAASSASSSSGVPPPTPPLCGISQKRLQDAELRGDSVASVSSNGVLPPTPPLCGTAAIEYDTVFPTPPPPIPPSPPSAAHLHGELRAAMGKLRRRGEDVKTNKTDLKDKRNPMAVVLLRRVHNMCYSSDTELESGRNDDWSE